jgi:Asp-tRNA(Asn)/Glu-tRNA(Gln) amidotransferase A subunit family amidase
MIAALSYQAQFLPRAILTRELNQLAKQKRPSLFVLMALNSYEYLNGAAFGASSLCVAVPSRLKTVESEQKPLAGMRIAIKDLFHLKGVHTGCGNRAYRMLHGALDTSSAAVESVLGLGGIIVGKTKTVEFGGSQEVIGDWCDYFYPINSRGDGYFAGTGSSTGSASSLAAYPWLDITLGTDGEIKLTAFFQNYRS